MGRGLDAAAAAAAAAENLAPRSHLSTLSFSLSCISALRVLSLSLPLWSVVVNGALRVKMELFGSKGEGLERVFGFFWFFFRAAAKTRAENARPPRQTGQIQWQIGDRDDRSESSHKMHGLNGGG